MNKLSILFAALFAVALSACGKKEEPVPPPAPVEQAAPAAEEAAPAAEEAAPAEGEAAAAEGEAAPAAEEEKK